MFRGMFLYKHGVAAKTYVMFFSGFVFAPGGYFEMSFLFGSTIIRFGFVDISIKVFVVEHQQNALVRIPAQWI